MSETIRGYLMKAETEKLIEWAKKQFTMMSQNAFSMNIIIDGTWKIEDTAENCKKMKLLLDKFKTVEKQLTNGGLIQDVRGNICQAGDEIREEGYDEREGYLVWDSEERRFCFAWDNIIEPLGYMDFVKIEG